MLGPLRQVRLLFWWLLLLLRHFRVVLQRSDSHNSGCLGGFCVEAEDSLLSEERRLRGSASFQKGVWLLQLVLSCAKKGLRPLSHFRLALTELNSAKLQFQHGDIAAHHDTDTGLGTGLSQ